MMDITVSYKENNIFYNVLCFLITENEKLFDRSDAKLYWRTVLHVLAIYHHALVGIFAGTMEDQLRRSEETDLNMLFKFRAAYLTGWSFLFQSTFLFLALAHDALEWASKEDSKLASRIRYWRDVLFAGLVVPYTCFVFGMFWTLYAINRELVFPSVYDAVVPWWFNHCVHTNILVMVVLETVLQPRRQPADRRLELILDASVGILYAVVYYAIYFFAGRWLYNIFGILNWWQVCLYQVLIWSSSYVFYEMQWPINRLIHGKEPDEEKQEQNSSEHTIQNIEALNGNGKENGGFLQDGDCEKTSSFQNGGSIQNGGTRQDGGTDKNGCQSVIGDLKAPPFSTKSWSLKYRTIRNQFENSKL